MMNKLEAKAVERELMYAAYYESPLPDAARDFLFLQTVAVKADRKVLRCLLANFSTSEKLKLILFAFTHYREGSFVILEELQEFKTLIRGLRKNYFDVQLFSRLVERKPSEIIDALNLQAVQETKELYPIFREFVARFADYIIGIYKQAGKELEGRSIYSDLFTEYSYSDFENFIKLFGLRGYPPIFVSDPDEPDSLLAKCKALSLFNNLQPVHVQQIHSFFSAILRHIQAIKHDLYKEGVLLFSVAIATARKDLSKSPTLVTLLEAYEGLPRNPIYVYDHSDEPLFAKNGRYIKKLNRLYKSSIVHVSRDEALEKMPVKGLIEHFGFGGARNCQYLLAPTSLILMLDDDMELPVTSIRSSALGALDAKKGFIGYVGFQKGRVTKTDIRYWDLHDVLHTPEKLFPKWSDSPSWAGISECLTKPKICLNLPYGCEERHLNSLIKTHYFLQPAYHLAGTRYPTGPMPTKPYVGLEGYLEKSIPQALLIGMISTLVDPTNSEGRCALPWNDPHMHFSSLEDALCYMAKGDVQKEVAKRFYKNLADFFNGRYPSFYYDSLQRLMSLDVDAVKLPLATSAQEKRSLKAICSLYKDFQQDARLFWQSGKTLTFSDNPAYPLTRGLCLLNRSLGQGEFSQLVRLLLQNTKK